MPKANILLFGNRGMNGSADPRLIGMSQYAKGVNVALHQQCVGTRQRVKVHELVGDDISGLNLQGACVYNPGRGQSFQGFGADFSAIALAAGGRTFLILPGSGFTVSDITGTLERNRLWHQCNLYQAENYLIAQQPTDNTWIYDGRGHARWSLGLDVGDKEASEISNGATAGVYAHGRIHQVVNARQILVGDIIHKTSGSNAINILGMTEQSYWATGSWFAPPSDWDEIVAMTALAQSNTTDGHDAIMCHSPSGVMSLRSNVYPRSEWSGTEMIHHIVIGAGAMGPWAVTSVLEGDQIFRSRYGIQSLRLNPAQNAQLGAPVRNIGEEADVWLSRDSEPLLRYASLAKLEKQRRLFCTTSPMVIGDRWMHRGIVVMNLLPSGTRDITPAWEGLMTLPDEIKHPAMMVTGEFDREQRAFVFCYGTDGKLRLAEIMADRGDDIGAGCVRSRIPCSVVTGAFVGASAESAAGYPLFKKTFLAIGAAFSQISGQLDWKVEFRTDINRNWKILASDGKAVFASCDSSDPFASFHPGQARTRYAIPDDDQIATWIQARVSWLGCANLDGVWVDYKTYDPQADTSEFDTICQSIPVENCDGDFDHKL